jgi:hypothetical protein
VSSTDKTLSIADGAAADRGYIIARPSWNRTLLDCRYQNKDSMTTSEFSAGQQALGYIYQARYALFLILERDIGASATIESIDDIVLSDDGDPTEILQLKHHTGTSSTSLSDYSSDLWKTLRVWSTYFSSKSGSNENIFTLISTATAPINSIAAMLSPNKTSRDEKTALRQLKQVTQDSTSSTLRPAFEAFLALSPQKQEELVKAIHILDGSLCAIMGETTSYKRLT